MWVCPLDFPRAQLQTCTAVLPKDPLTQAHNHDQPLSPYQMVIAQFTVVYGINISSNALNSMRHSQLPFKLL